jgi:hypothetical protein
MGQPTWRELAKVKVPETSADLWTKALDYVTPGKLYRIAVEPVAAQPPATGMVVQKWTPESGTGCTADGDASLARTGSIVLDTSPAGALIAKVGGSTADVQPDKDKLLVFSAGRHCVFSVADAAKAGSLYLGINDTAGSRSRVTGQLEVTIYEGL